jgi:hypothetical protein
MKSQSLQCREYSFFCNGSAVTDVTTRWAKEHDLTDMLLTVLEDDPVMRVAFSMDKGAETKNKSSAKTVADHHRSLALRVLIAHDSGRWKDASITQMGNVVKNRVNA